MTKTILCIVSILALMVISGCTGAGSGGPQLAESREIAELTRGISALGTDIDPDEAARAARIAYEHTYQLAQQYQITDSPLIHNTKVNLGLRPRGLCRHWAEDMEARLKQEDFQTLDIHRAIANAENPFRLEHSTALVSRRGETMFDGIVLDPWRFGGVLHWARTVDDTDYKWRPRQEVLAQKWRRIQAMKRAEAAG